VKILTAPETGSAAPKKVASSSPADDGEAVPTKAIVRDVTPKKEKVAAVSPPVVTGPQPTGAGYVAVLASVPASGSSRIDALKQFADMQQKYTTILQNKTPDVQEADLGTKGTYHRLLVGPPGSRETASQVCTQLKAQGYSGCWVTAY
jgi:cell division septation protein DedD